MEEDFHHVEPKSSKEVSVSLYKKQPSNNRPHVQPVKRVPKSQSKKALNTLGAKKGKTSKKADRESHVVAAMPQLAADMQECPRWIFDFYLRVNVPATEMYTLCLHQDIPIVTDSSGTYSSTFGNAPTSFMDWTNLAQDFEEFRVIGMRSMYKPYDVHGGSTASVFTDWMTMIDRDSLTPITSYSQGLNYASLKEHKALSSWTRVILMSGSEDSGWLNSASGTTNTFFLKAFTAGNSASFNLGRVLNTIVVQLRSRGL